jgi:DNA-binding LacI/PurR family transcriptional regulator/DNA-binding transcriptional regulator YhcF (GntR family)
MAQRFLSHAQQLAAHLRSEILRGKWIGSMPGILRLEGELGVNRNTIDAALKLLEKEEMLKGQGAGRKRRIVLPENHSTPALRVAILLHEPRQESEGYMNELYHLLSEAGHTPSVAPQCLTAVRMDVNRIARMVKQISTDAWVVGAGSREILAWFAEQEPPTFSLFGRHADFPIAAVAPDKVPAYATATRRLIALGHRRISFLCHRAQRLPRPAKNQRAILDQLKASGIKTNDFHLPDWKPTSKGFTAQLDAMFHHTPPTALILDEPYLYSAALHFLAERGLRVPHDVSLICADPDRSFIWSEPSVAHIRWDHRPVVRRVVHWVNNVALGKDDRRKSFTKAEFVEGGTIGPAP